jgi:hypothetical protein
MTQRRELAGLASPELKGLDRINEIDRMGHLRWQLAVGSWQLAVGSWQLADAKNGRTSGESRRENDLKTDD